MEIILQLKEHDANIEVFLNTNHPECGVPRSKAQMMNRFVGVNHQVDSRHQLASIAPRAGRKSKGYMPASLHVEPIHRNAPSSGNFSGSVHPTKKVWYNLSLKAVASLPVTFGTLRGPKAP